MQLVVGRIGRPHGIRGDVVVEVRTDDPDLRFAAGSVLATEPAARGPLTVSAMRWHSGRLLVSFAGFGDRDQADDLRGVLLVVDSADLEDPGDPDEFRDHQLIGLAVLTPAGHRVGTVTDVLHHGQDLLVIRPGDAAAAPERTAGGPGGPARPATGAPAPEILVPFVAPLVPEVDLGAGHLVIDPPPGLLDPDAAI
jgi:16S rRNA processing protein RimM